jgi:hypothetical protein
VPAGVTEATHDGLAPATSYYFRVGASSSVGPAAAGEVGVRPCRIVALCRCSSILFQVR